MLPLVKNVAVNFDGVVAAKFIVEIVVFLTERVSVHNMKKYFAKYGWCLFMGMALGFLHVHFWDWRFYAVMLPLIILVDVSKNYGN